MNENNFQKAIIIEKYILATLYLILSILSWWQFWVNN